MGLKNNIVTILKSNMQTLATLTGVAMGVILGFVLRAYK